MKLLCFNISIHEDNAKGVIDLIEKGDYDIILLQEVLYAHEDTCFNFAKVGNEIEKYFKNNYTCSFAPIYIARGQTVNGELIFDFGGKAEQGMMILTKHKLLSSTNEFYYNEYKYEYDFTHFKQKDWCRSLQNNKLEFNGNALQIINIHGYYSYDKIDTEVTLKQSDYILSRIENCPLIVAGDLNLLPTTKSIAILEKKLTNLNTIYKIKATRPTFKNDLDKGDLVCDYVFVNNKIKVNKFRTIDTKLSDHFALELEFEIK